MSSPSAADHERARVHKERAAKLAVEGRTAEAADEYLSALSLVPANVVVRTRLAELLARLGRTAEAVEHYLSLVGKYESDGYLQKAIATCNVLLGLDPSHAAAQSILADLHARRDAPKPPLRVPSSMSGEIRERTGALPPMIDPSTLAKVPLFSGLPPAAFESLVGELSRREVPAGEVIVEEGAPGDAMFAVVHGLVRVERRSVRGESRVIAELGEGEVFGEMSLLSRCPRLATVSAATDCELLVLERGALERIAAEHPGVLDIVTRFYRERLVANVLRASPVFQKLPPERRPPLREVFDLRAHPPETTLLEEGQKGSPALFLLLRGECEVFHVSRGKEEHLAWMREGDVFGEISLLQAGAVTASVRTSTSCVVLGMSQEWFADLLLSDRGVHDALQRLATRRLLRTQEVIAHEVLDDRMV